MTGQKDFRDSCSSSNMLADSGGPCRSFLDCVQDGPAVGSEIRFIGISIIKILVKRNQYELLNVSL